MISLPPTKPLQIVKKKAHGYLNLDHTKSLSPSPDFSMSQVSPAYDCFNFYIPATCEELESYDLNAHSDSTCSTPVDECQSIKRYPFPIPRSPSIISLTALIKPPQVLKKKKSVHWHPVPFLIDQENLSSSIHSRSSAASIESFTVEEDIEKLLAFVQESSLPAHKSAVSSHSAHDDGYSGVVFSSFSSGGEGHPHKERKEEGISVLRKFDLINHWLSDIEDCEWEFVEEYETERPSPVLTTNPSLTSDSSSESDSSGEEPFELVEYEGENIMFRAAVAERIKKVVVDDGSLMRKMKTKSKHALKWMKNAAK